MTAPTVALNGRVGIVLRLRADSGHARRGGLAELGPDQARLEQDHVDAEAAQLKAQGVGDRLERVLGRVVVARAGERQPPAHRADVDDLSPSLRAHLRQHQLGQARSSPNTFVSNWRRTASSGTVSIAPLWL